MTDEMVEDISRQMARMERMIAEMYRAHTTTPAPLADRSLTRRQAAEYLGIHAKTLATLTAAGDVTGYRDRPRGRWKYRITDLDRYRDDHAQDTRPRADHAAPIDWGA